MDTERETPDIESLPERMLAREESAYREFARTFHQQFYRFFRIRGIPDFAAEDLAANLIGDIPRKACKYRKYAGSSFKSWVWVIARNAAASWWRVNKKANTVEMPRDLMAHSEEDPAASEMDQVDVPESIAALHEALAQLGETDRQILELRDLGGARSFAEIAKLLNINVNAAKTRRTRARNHLKEILARDPRIRDGFENSRDESRTKEIA